MKTLVPVFFSAGDAAAPLLATAVNSLKTNASARYAYHIHILTDDFSSANRRKLERFRGEDFALDFHPLRESLRALPWGRELEEATLQTLAECYCFLIPELFPAYDKAICLDADLVVSGDISQLYCEPLGSKSVGAVVDFSAENSALTEHLNYVNSAVLLLDCRRIREEQLSLRLAEWARRYSLEGIAPAQEYLNDLCRDGIRYLDPDWNARPADSPNDADSPKIVRFNLLPSPPSGGSFRYNNLFWKYAATSGYGPEILIA